MNLANWLWLLESMEVIGVWAADSFAQQCQSFSPQGYIPHSSRQTVQYVPAGTNLSFYGSDSKCSPVSSVAPVDLCRVAVSVSTSSRSGVDIELWLPRNWTGRFIQTGNGGLDGCIKYSDMEYTTSNGFASAGSNNGHDGPTVEALYQNDEATIDFAWRALHTSTVTSKTLTNSFYARPLNKSYFIGCSLGGRQGIDSAGRFPGDFDGILAGAPAVNFNNLSSWRASFFPITGTPESERFVTEDQWKGVVHDEVLRQCDGIDGVEDGVITDPTLCDFRPEMLLCGGEDAVDECLTAAQVDTVRRVLSPLLDEDGSVIYPAMQPGSELNAAAGLFSGEPWRYSEEWFQYVVYANPTWDPATFTIHDAHVADSLNPGGIRTWPDTLSQFQSRGGKILMYHGQQDEKISSFNSQRWYEHLSAGMGMASTEMDGFLRFFRIPGMFHCADGPGAWRIGQGGGKSAAGVPFDMRRNVLAALVVWVEGDEAPDGVVGIGDHGVEREHCRYPLRCMYVGGDPSVVESWRCEHI